MGLKNETPAKSKKELQHRNIIAMFMPYWVER